MDMMSSAGKKQKEVLPPVRDFFRGKCVLVTGASGFVGRTLLEKLLREAPEIGTIYMLVRPKKGRSPVDRLQPLTNVKLFDRLRREQPAALSKLHPLAGDVEEPGLGLSAEDVALVQREVHVVFHAAASVRFDDTLRKAVMINVRGTREACELAKGMSKLQAFVHVSTAYCNADRDLSDEKLYPSPGDWRAYIKAAETLPDLLLTTITKKLLGLYPNTYVFTKALAENVISDYKHELPVCILRPSLVMGTYMEPFPGWIDNTYGPIGACLAGIVGLNHVNPNADRYMDCIPVDMIVNALIIISMKCTKEGKGKLHIVNGSSYDCHDKIFDFSILGEYVNYINLDYPADTLYKPFCINVKSKFIATFLIYFLDLMICMFYEILLRLKGHKKGITFIYRMMFLTIKRGLPFSRGLVFPNKNFIQLNELISSDDKEAFEVNVKDTSMFPYHFVMAHQIKKYLLKQKKHYPMKQLIIMEIVHYAICGLLLWCIWRMKILSYAFQTLLQASRFFLML